MQIFMTFLITSRYMGTWKSKEGRGENGLALEFSQDDSPERERAIGRTRDCSRAVEVEQFLPRWRGFYCAFYRAVKLISGERKREREGKRQGRTERSRFLKCASRIAARLFLDRHFSYPFRRPERKMK